MVSGHRAARAPRYTLALDASMGWAGVALLRDERAVAVHQVHAPRQGARVLLESVDAVLAAGGIELADIALFAATTGPGSFTGIRIGLATARALAWALGRPLVGVGTLDALAAPLLGAAAPGDVVAAVIDARKQQVYWGAWQAGTPARCLAPPAASEPGEAAASLASLVPPGGRLLPCGDAWEVYATQLSALPRPDASHGRVDPVVVAAVARRRLESGAEASWQAAEPVYVRASEAEQNIGPPLGQAVFEERAPSR